MSKPTIIFDFDGVLAHSEEVLLEALNFALKSLGIRELNKKEYKNKSKLELLKSRKIGKFKLALLIFIARRYMNKNHHRILKNDEIINFLSKIQLKKRIVSSNSTKNIRLILKEDTSLFLNIIGGVGLYSKHRVLKRYAHNSIYITDEIRDIIACKKVNLPVYAVTWGVDSKEKLLSEKPCGLFETPHELKDFLEKF